MKQRRHMPKTVIAFILALCLILQTGVSIITVAAADDAPTTTIERLQVEYMENPIGIDANSIHFNWNMVSELRGQSQKAYQIMVASSKEKLANGDYDMWNTDKVESDSSVGIEYKGEPLNPSTRYFWQVKVWDQNGKEITSTEESYFETSLLDSGWDNAQWIGKKAEVDPNPDVTKFTVEFDFELVSDNMGIAFGAKDGSNFFMWQVNSSQFRTDKDPAGLTNRVYLRPHIKQNGGWAVLPPSSGGTGGGKEYDITDAIGYDATSIQGQTIHMKIAVDNGVVTTYFNHSDTPACESYDFGKPISVGKIAFRHNTDQNSTEIAKYDNFEVKDGEGKMLFSQNFDDATNPWFNGGTIEDGMLKVGKTSGGETIVMQNFAPGTSAPMVRKDFTTDADKTVESARVYSTAAGLYELYLNGKKVGQDYFNPGYTDYNIRTVYQTFDITDMLNEGDNAIGAMLGRGWYCGNITHVGANRFGTDPALLAKIVINYTNGDSDVIVTDGSWSVNTNGPITDNNFLNGEKYNANKEVPGWDNTGFTPNEDWGAVGVFTAKDLGIGSLEAQIGEKVQQIATLNVKEVTEPKDNAFIYDLGQNYAGVVRLDLPGDFTAANKGKTISLRFGEMLNDDSGTGDDVEGSLYDENLRTFDAIDTYTIKGDPNGESYTPRFTFHGFRYVEITGIDEALPKDWVTGVALGNALEQAGDFTTDNAKINQLYSNIVWGQRSNFLSIPTDCPQRNERMGWTGDAQVFARTATYNAQAREFYTKYLADMRSSQRSDGAYSDVAPAQKVYATYWNGGWADAGVIIPWQIYQQYGDVQVIKDMYESMKKYVDMLKRDVGDSYLRGESALGDWLYVVKTPSDITNTAFVAYSASLLSKMATVIGEDADAANYADFAEKVRNAWRNKFQTEDGLIYDTQTSYLIALEFDMVKDEDRAQMASLLEKNIRENDYRLTVGFVGVSYLCNVLSDYGYDNVAFRLLQQEDYPSWLYTVNQGATTMWERWNSYTKEGGFGPVSMNSFNHYSFGSIGEWMFRNVLGIERDEENAESAGYKHFTLQPTFGGTLNQAKGYYDSAYGRINSGWTIDGADFSYSATIPANTTATLYLPADSVSAVYESGKNVLTDSVDGITYVKTENGCAVFELASGSYSFSSTAISKAQLNQAIDEAGRISRMGVTAESYEPLLALYNEANVVVHKTDVSAEQIATLVADINAAIENLDRIPGAGTGTEADPFRIRTADDLALLAKTVNEGFDLEDQFVRLENDLDLNNMDWTPIGVSDCYYFGRGFAGTFDGNSYVISNFSISDTAEYQTFGLFGMVSGTVKNLGVKNMTANCGVLGDARVGGVVGTLFFGKVSNCYVTDSNLNPGPRVAAGLVGQSWSGRVENSFVRDITVRGGRYATFVSDNQADDGSNRGRINNCYSDGSLTSNLTGFVNDSKENVAKEDFTNGTLVGLLNAAAGSELWEQGENHPVLKAPVTVDKTVLTKAIAAAAAYEGNEADYTPESWKAFSDALAAANAANENPTATQDEVNAAAAALTEAMFNLRYKADKTVLIEVIAAAAAYEGKEAEYTPESWKTFSEALKAANAANENPAATQDDVDAAAEALNSAIKGLTPAEVPEPGDANKTILKKVLDYAKAAKETNEYQNVIESVKKSFDAAYATAENVYVNAEATQTEVDSAWTVLMKEIHKLGLQAGDKSKLQADYDLYSEWDLNNYVDGAEKDAFVAALAKAEAVLKDGDAMTEEINEADEALVAAAGKLVEIAKTDKTSLQTAVDKAAGCEKENYVTEGWSEFEKALGEARAVLEREEASQQEINEACSSLVDAMMQLRYKADKSILEKLVSSAEEMDLSGYTAASVEQFKRALKDAKAVNEDESLTKEDQRVVDDTVSGLTEAIKGLVRRDGAANDVTVNGDGTINQSGSSAKTGETTPIAMAVAMAALAGMAFIASKRRKK